MIQLNFRASVRASGDVVAEDNRRVQRGRGPVGRSTMLRRHVAMNEADAPGTSIVLRCLLLISLRRRSALRLSRLRLVLRRNLHWLLRVRRPTLSASRQAHTEEERPRYQNLRQPLDFAPHGLPPSTTFG